MKYKVGDRVRIKSLDWYNKNKSKSHGTVACGDKYFEYDMKEWCGKTMTILEVYQTFYMMEEDWGKNSWTDEMIEGLVEEETASEKILEVRDKHYWDMLGGESKNEITLPQGYQFKDENGNVINATKIVLEKKKKEYPKTYEECAEIIAELTGSDCNPKGCMGYMSVQLTALQKLLICRDAYWKLYGEEMGLEKPWEPDWDGGSLYLFYYNPHRDEFVKIHYSLGGSANSIFVFPTAEMRDAYKENFGPDIEKCKLLL